APASASVRRIARPRPRVPPVTRATRPVRSKSSAGERAGALSSSKSNRLLGPEMAVAAFVGVFPDRAAVDEDVEMPEHLPDDEDGLRLGDLVRPEAARDRERRGAAAGDEAGDPVQALAVEGKPLLDQCPMVVDGRAVARIAARELHHLGLPEVAQVLEQSAAPLVTRKLRRHDLGTGADIGKQMVAD